MLIIASMSHVQRCFLYAASELIIFMWIGSRAAAAGQQVCTCFPTAANNSQLVHLSSSQWTSKQLCANWQQPSASASAAQHLSAILRFSPHDFGGYWFCSKRWSRYAYYSPLPRALATSSSEQGSKHFDELSHVMTFHSTIHRYLYRSSKFAYPIGADWKWYVLYRCHRN
jgi:hypothetical protein